MSMPPADFTPTHVVPTGGLPAWATPDPSQEVVATIEGCVEVVVREERGAWAEVLCSNGWSAWVDGRRLVAVGAASPTASPPPTARTAAKSGSQFDAETLKRLATPPVVGAAVLVVGTLLPWSRGIVRSNNAFDIPISALWSWTATSSPIKLGVVLLLLGVAGGVLVSRAGVQRYRMAVGGVAAVCIVVEEIQAYRALSRASISYFEVTSFGAPVALIGAVALAVAPLAWPKRG